MGFSTWFIAFALSLAIGVGGAAPGTLALPLVDDAAELVDDVVNEDADDEDADDEDADDEDAGGLLDSVVEEVVTPVVEEVVDPVVDPVVDEVVDPIVDEIIDDVDEVVEPEPDDDTTLPATSGPSGTSDPSDPEASPSPPEDLRATPEPSASVIATLEASEQQAGITQPSPVTEQVAVERRSDDRLAAMLLATSQPASLGTALQPLDGVLAWLTNGPSIARLLAAPLALLNLIIRALLSAGSGLVAPLSLTVAIVVRQLRRGPQEAPGLLTD